ncbi:MAG: sensor histidine kinase [Vicinamibacterales bacterium]
MEGGRIVTARWLARFRWAVGLGAAVLLVVGRGVLGLQFSLGVVGTLLGALGLSNLWLESRLRSDEDPGGALLGSVVLLDVVLLTGMLLSTGGPANPFTVAYLVYITLAAVTLDARWTWGVAVAAVLGYASLFIGGLGALVDPAHAAHQAAMPSQTGHLAGMWVAFMVAAALTASFVTRIRTALEERELALAAARQETARHERLASLTTLAAGAAHELATPLGTILIAARELERAADEPGVPPAVVDDVRLIAEQVSRCRTILDQMSGRADESVAEPPELVDPVRAACDAVALLPAGRDRVHVRPDTGVAALRLPRVGLVRVLVSIIKNGLEAGGDGQDVVVDISPLGNGVRLSVTDTGAGMGPDVLARAGEPFFTTKPPGQGFGLGLFLARTFAERWGGRFDLRSTPGQGTSVSLEFDG